MISLNEAVHATAKSNARTQQIQNLGAPGCLVSKLVRQHNVLVQAHDPAQWPPAVSNQIITDIS